MELATGGRRDLTYAAGGLVVAVVAAMLYTSSRMQGPWAVVLAYVVIWVPLLGAVLVACSVACSGSRSVAGSGAGSASLPESRWRLASAKLGLRFSVFDLFWGVAAGCLARAFDASVNLMLYGTTGLVPLPLVDGGGLVVVFLLTGFLAPVVLAPVIEEVFFRGLLQRSLITVLESTGSRVSRPMRIGAAVVGVVVTSAVFALVHLVGAAPTVLLGTFVFALAAGGIAAATGRIGGSIVAHVVFNGIAVVLTWPY